MPIVCIEEIKSSLAKQSWKVDDDFLGEGGFSKVLKISRNNHDYAAKVVQSTKEDQTYANDNKLAMHEVRIMREIGQHKSLVCLYEYYDDSILFAGSPKILVVDFLSKGSLLEVLTKQDNYTDEHAQHIAMQLLSGVEFMHSKYIVHRDLKVDNIFMSDVDTFQLKIGDFGHAVKTDKDGLVSGLVGTPHYMPPECSGESHDNYTNKFDVWSLGVIFYILLTGQFLYPDPLFRPPAVSIKEHKIWQRNPKIWKKRPKAKDLIKSMLTEDPDKRVSVVACLTHKWFKDYQQKNTNQRLGTKRSTGAQRPILNFSVGLRCKII